MLLTPTETARLMSTYESKEVTVRQVYYLLERYAIVALKIGQSIRITEEEIVQHYGGDTRTRERIAELTGDIRRYRYGPVPAFERIDYIPPDICRTAESVSRGRARVEHLKKRSCRVLQDKRDTIAQLEFDFAA
jgi:hypothetical protein